MQIVAPLIAGISGAEGGYAKLFKRGTSTRATWYADFEGVSSDSSGADIPLDANGRAVVYVNEYVDVQVVDSDGDAVVDFTVGNSTNDVEYRGQSFTGVDYQTAAAAANNPVSVQALMDLWKTQNGSIDWKVAVGATAQTLPTWLAALLGLLFNVKDPTYGALGDGVTDDTGAITAAIAAANAAGGGTVFFPPGDYYVTSVLTVSAGVNLLGAGPNVATLSINHATASLLQTAAATYFWTRIEGLRLTAAQTNTGQMLSNLSTSKLILSNCYIGGANCTGNALVEAANTANYAIIEDCAFDVGGSAGAAIDTSVLTGRWKVNRCRFTTPATCTPTNDGIVYGTKIDLTDCEFDVSATSSGTLSCFTASSTTLDGEMRGNIISAGGGGTIRGYSLGTPVSGSKFFESNTRCPGQSASTFTLYIYSVLGSVSGDAQDDMEITLQTRDARRYTLESDDDTFAFDPRNYGHIDWHKSGNTTITLVAPTTYPFEGHRTRLTIWADNGAIAGVSMGSTLFGATDSGLTDQHFSSWLLEMSRVFVSGNERIRQVAIAERLDATR